MGPNQAAIGLLIIILLIVGANVIMYAIARGAIRRPNNKEGGTSHWLLSLKDSLSKPMDTPASRSMEELRKRVKELEKKKDE